ncbi:MAG TPA: DMT family transporter [Ramlibacter sp.]|nr:DMT family transporter [Ramlibacter sp.]
MPAEGPRARQRWLRYAGVLHWRARRAPAEMRALAWAVLSGIFFVLLNALLRALSLDLHPFQTQFLRYSAAIVILLPLVLRTGVARWRPRHIRGQFVRGFVHTVGLTMWFFALPHLALADTTAIGFTQPLWIMLGAALLLAEPMRWDRWVAALAGLAGVLIVVAHQMTGAGGFYSLLMLASSPVFAASFLITKALTRYERPEVIVAWQAVTVTIFSLPLALLYWRWPGPWQWAGFLACGVLGSLGQYCITRSLAGADASATQSVKFLDLVWAAGVGWLMFADVPSRWTLLGGAVICASTVWIARREMRGRAPG